MQRFISFRRINEILKKDFYRNGENFFYDDNNKVKWLIQCEVDELQNLKFINISSEGGTNWIHMDLDYYKITSEWYSFVYSYKSYIRKLEYFFMDFPFFWALIIWLFSWLIWTLLGFILSWKLWNFL